MSNTLDGMTQAKWDALSPFERLAMRDTSDLHPMLRAFEGKRVKVYPPREYGRSSFIVGRTTGWRPVYIAMRANAHGSSDVIRVDERIDRVEVLDR